MVYSKRIRNVLFLGFFCLVNLNRLYSIDISLSYDEEDRPSWDRDGRLLMRTARAAAQIWEDLLPANDDYSFSISWDALDGNKLGEAQVFDLLDDAAIDIDWNQDWFIDPTPLDHSEYNLQPMYWKSLTTQQQRDWFRPMNIGLTADNYMEVGFLGKGNGTATEGRFDLLSTLLHEIGHALGITASDPFAGDFGVQVGSTNVVLKTETDSGLHLKDEYALMFASNIENRRVLPSLVDMLAVAQDEEFSSVDSPRKEFDPLPVFPLGSAAEYTKAGNWHGNRVPDSQDEIFLRSTGAIQFPQSPQMVNVKNILVGEDTHVLLNHSSVVTDRLTLKEHPVLPYKDADPSEASPRITELHITESGMAVNQLIADGARIIISNTGNDEIVAIKDTLKIKNSDNRTGDLIGRGTISANRLENDGILQASGGFLEFRPVDTEGSYDLDGPNETGVLRLGGGNMFFRGQITDAYDGLLTIPQNRAIHFDKDWAIGPNGVLSMQSTHDIPFRNRPQVNGAGTATIQGKLEVTGDAQFNSPLVVEGEIELNNGPDHLFSSQALTLRNGKIRGDDVGLKGTLVQLGPLRAEGSDDENEIDTQFFVWGGDTTVAPGAVLNITVENFGTLQHQRDYFDKRLVVAGDLNINRLTAWEMRGRLDMVGGKIGGTAPVMKSFDQINSLSGDNEINTILQTGVVTQINISSDTSLHVDDLRNVPGQTKFDGRLNLSGEFSVNREWDLANEGNFRSGIISGDDTFTVSGILKALEGESLIEPTTIFDSANVEISDGASLNVQGNTFYRSQNEFNGGGSLRQIGHATIEENTEIHTKFFQFEHELLVQPRKAFVVRSEQILPATDSTNQKLTIHGGIANLSPGRTVDFMGNQTLIAAPWNLSNIELISDSRIPARLVGGPGTIDRRMEVEGVATINAPITFADGTDIHATPGSLISFGNTVLFAGNTFDNRNADMFFDKNVTFSGPTNLTVRNLDLNGRDNSNSLFVTSGVNLDAQAILGGIQGTLTVAPGGRLHIRNGRGSVEPWTISGTLHLDGGENGQRAYFGSSNVIATGDFNVTGTAELTFGTVNARGDVNIADQAKLFVGKNSNLVLNNGHIRGAGELFLTEESQLIGFGTISTSIHQTGDLIAFGPRLLIDGPLSALDGTVGTVADASVLEVTQPWGMSGRLRLVGGTIAGASIGATGEIIGRGAIDVPNVSFSSILSPGLNFIDARELNIEDPIGQLTFGGDVQQLVNGVALMQISGAAADEFDRVVIEGDATLGGTLSVELLDGFQPTAGHRFDLFDWRNVSGTFRNVQVPPLPGAFRWDFGELYSNGIVKIVPGGLLGDFNLDGHLGVEDIDLLTAAVAQLSNDLAFDLDGNQSIDQEDRRIWVKDLKNTWFGDANLDGEFNTGDFVQVFGVGEYEDGVPNNSTWADGDWNGDQEFGTSDFVTAFNDGGFEMGPRPVNFVPEPTEQTMLFLVCIGFAARFCARRNPVQV